MESWQKIVLSRLILHPRLKTLRHFQFRKVLEFVELAARCDDIYGPLGVVELLDDEIAAELEMSTHQFLLLRDEMLLRDIVRMTGNVRASRYEVAFWLLPDQTARDHSIQDGRTKALWDTEAPSIEYLFADLTDPGDTSKKARSGRERTALSRWRGKFTQANRRRPTGREEALFLEEYRERVRAEEAAAAQGDDTAPVTQVCNETSQPACNDFPIVTAQTTELEENLREDNNNKPPIAEGNGNESDVVVAFFGNNVTPPAPENVTDKNVTSPVTESAAENQGETPGALTARLLSWDVAAHVAAQLVKEGALPFMREQLDAMPEYIAAEESRTRQKVRGAGGFVRRVVEQKWPLPPEYKKRRAQERDKARREADAAHQAAQTASAELRYTAFEQSLTEEERGALVEQAKARMSETWRKKWDETRPPQEQAGPVRGDFNTEYRKLAHERLTQEEDGHGT